MSSFGVGRPNKHGGAKSFLFDGAEVEIGLIPIVGLTSSVASNGGILRHFQNGIWMKARLNDYIGINLNHNQLKRWDGSQWLVVNAAGL